MLNKILFFIILLLIVALPRFAYLNSVPSSINQDQLHYSLDAKSFLLTGKDILGKNNLLDLLVFHSPQSDPMQAELPYFLELPVLGIFNFSLANNALPNVILGILTVMMIFLITKELFNQKAAYLAALIAAINPWLIFLSRTSYEALPATFFFLCVFYAFLKLKNWKILFTIPIAIFAFYSYIGTKIIFVPFILLCILYAYFVLNKKQYFKQYLIVFLFSVIFTLFFFFQITHSGTARVSEILTPNNPRVIKQVNEDSHTTINNPLMRLTENKYYVFGTILVRNTADIFSPVYLFVNADYFFISGAFGLFYYIDAVFLFIGLFALLKYSRKLFMFFIALIVIAIIPHVIHFSEVNSNFTPHVALLIPVFVILIGLGLSKSMEAFKNKKIFYAFCSIIVLIYLILFAAFINEYFFRFPLQQGTFEPQNRVLSKYIMFSVNENRLVVVFSSNQKQAFKEFLFYSNLYNKDTASLLNKTLANGEYQYKNIVFSPCGVMPAQINKDTRLMIRDINCFTQVDVKGITIGQWKDSGKKYIIYNDKVCSQYSLPPYISNLSLPDLNIENLNQKTFCEKFIIGN